MEMGVYYAAMPATSRLQTDTGSVSTAEPSREATLDDRWPPFLDLLDRSSGEAWAQFYSFARRLLELRAPGVVRRLQPEDREDVLADLVQDFQESDFRLLRTYRDTGRPFAVWFCKALRNRALDRMKYNNRRAHEELSPTLPLHAVSPHIRAEFQDALERVAEAFDRLSPECRLLLGSAAEGITPKELERLLGLPAGENKGLADRTRNCRKRLRKKLGDVGIDVSEWI
jgi:RNA polymerase sigma factor (sigma-70 family)